MVSESGPGRFYISRKISAGDWVWDKLTCIVCSSEIYEFETKIFCPYCGVPSHREHILEWVKIKGTCPNCNRKLSIRDLTPGG